MTLATRIILILTLVASIAGRALAQETATAETTTTAADTDTAETTTTIVTSQNSDETRNQFASLLRHHPPELATILKLDPTLLSNEAFLTGYPELAQYVVAHPEVRRNPRFYLSDFQLPIERRTTVLNDLMEMMAVLGSMLLIAFALAWLVRTVIEQKRWNRLSRSQSEVHNKILDRFGTSAELLEYVRTPAGTKFLESAPIALHAERAPVQNLPLMRVIWSIQLGIVVVAGSLGMLAVSGRFDAESAQGFFALGVIALCVGAGFIASAVVSLVLSRRLGLYPSPDAS